MDPPQLLLQQVGRQRTLARPMRKGIQQGEQSVQRGIRERRLRRSPV